MIKLPFVLRSTHESALAYMDTLTKEITRLEQVPQTPEVLKALEALDTTKQMQMTITRLKAEKLELERNTSSYILKLEAKAHRSHNKGAEFSRGIKASLAYLECSEAPEEGKVAAEFVRFKMFAHLERYTDDQSM